MASSLVGYDAWLEAPYQRRYEEADAYHDFCESMDLDPDTDEAENEWQDHNEAMADAQAEAQAEARLEARWDEGPYDDY
jgi:hypothetical protein